MVPLHPVDWEILNATADDREDLERIYLAVCFEYVAVEGVGAYRPLPGVASLRVVADRLRAFVETALLTAVTDDGRSADPRDGGCVWTAWFAITAEGRRL